MLNKCWLFFYYYHSCVAPRGRYCASCHCWHSRYPKKCLFIPNHPHPPLVVFIQGEVTQTCARGCKVGVLTSVEMVPHGEEGHVEGHIPHRRVGLEDGDDGNLDEHEEDRVLPGARQGRERGGGGQSGTRPTRVSSPQPWNPNTLSRGLYAGQAPPPTKHRAGPSRRAKNCRDPKMPTGSEKNPAHTRDSPQRHFPSTPTPRSSGPSPRSPEEENKWSQQPLSLGLNDCLSE